ncbi:MAG: hypothetical protein HW421_240 [Ignavibacteria bacterium]|nr:hypothetical protein [Ignavibacteria bacterium]
MHENPNKEAMSYIGESRKNLQLAGNDGIFYNDEMYVKTACGIAYTGLLKAMDFYFDIKGTPKRRGRKSIEYYQTVLKDMDKTLLKHLNCAYRILYLNGYYEGETKIKAIEVGLDSAISIISKLKPYSKNGFKI